MRFYRLLHLAAVGACLNLGACQSNDEETTDEDVEEVESPPTADAPATLCRRAQILALYVTGVTGFDDSVDYCETRSLPPALYRAVNQVIELHARIQAKVGAAVLLPTGLFLVIDGTPLGFWSSHVRMSGNAAPVLSMGVFPDWNGEPLEAGVYAHELGHALPFFGDGGVPEMVATYALLREGRNFMSETYGDTLALAVEGRLTSGTSELPACLDGLRNLDEFGSYDQPLGDFTGGATMRRLNACCASLKNDDAHTARSAVLCRMIKSANPNPGTEPEDRPLRADDLADAKADVDPHLIGFPFASFLAAMEREGLDTWAAWDGALRAASEPDAYEAFTCSVPALPELRALVAERVPSLTFALRTTRSELTRARVDVVEAAWARHGLDMAIDIAERETRLVAELSFIDKVRAAPKRYFENGDLDPLWASVCKGVAGDPVNFQTCPAVCAPAR